MKTTITALLLTMLPLHAESRVEKRFCSTHPGVVYLSGQRYGYCPTEAERIDKPTAPQRMPHVVYFGQDWIMAHVPMPICPDGSKRTIDLPERDEVDAFTITCKAPVPTKP